MISGNLNFYAIDQFENPLAVGNDSAKVNFECPPWQVYNNTIEKI